MGTSYHNPNPKSNRLDEPELDLYTIPRYSSWFTWDDIHETERAALKEFFDGSSITRTPKIYKEYREFIINKYREDPSRRLTFTEIRKSLVGDVTLLRKVFRFLDKWGLINFGAANSSPDDLEKEEGMGEIRVEDGAPNGLRVVATPNSLKPISVPKVANGADVVEKSGLKLPPLASYSDVFGESGKQKGSVCGNCGGSCDSGRYEFIKGNYFICKKCFDDGTYGANRSKEDFNLNESVHNIGVNGAEWTEAETLLLLENVLKHGDNWDLVAQSVQTKTKLQCISRLIELPFGDLILGSASGRSNSTGLNGSTNSSQEVPLSSSEHQDLMQTENQLHEQTSMNQQNGDSPSKRQRLASLSDSGSYLMKQVTLVSSMVGTEIAAAAAEAAVGALCEESSCPREIFDGVERCPTNGLWLPILHSEYKREHQSENLEMKERSTQSEMEDTSAMQNDLPLSFRIRTAVATALGAAAAHAKLLADQEDREIENLVATVIETQVKKLHGKLKHVDDLELIMEKEYTEMNELKELLNEERIDVLRRSVSAGISKWRDGTSVKPQNPR